MKAHILLYPALLAVLLALLAYFHEYRQMVRTERPAGMQAPTLAKTVSSYPDR
jgi:hypothetical protein